jgi:hypothetical protein
VPLTLTVPPRLAANPIPAADDVEAVTAEGGAGVGQVDGDSAGGGHVEVGHQDAGLAETKTPLSRFWYADAACVQAREVTVVPHGKLIGYD